MAKMNVTSTSLKAGVKKSLELDAGITAEESKEQLEAAAAGADVAPLAMAQHKK